MKAQDWVRIALTGALMNACVVDATQPPVDLNGGDAAGSTVTGGREPAAGEPAAGEPVGGEAVAGEPVAGEPAAGEPAAGEPAAGEPVAGEPVAGEPVAGEPVAGEPVGGEPVAGEPVGGEPVAGEPVGGEPVAGEPVGGEPVAGEPVGGEPVGGEPTPLCDGTEQSAEEVCDLFMACYESACPDGATPVTQVHSLCMQSTLVVGWDLICSSSCDDLISIPGITCEPPPPEPGLCESLGADPSEAEVCDRAVECYQELCPQGTTPSDELRGSCLEITANIGTDLLCEMTCTELNALTGASCEPDPPELDCSSWDNPITACNELYSCVEQACPYSEVEPELFTVCLDTIESYGYELLCVSFESCGDYLPLFGQECLNEPPPPEPSVCGDAGGEPLNAELYCDRGLSCLRERCPFTEIDEGFEQLCVAEAESFGVELLCSQTCTEIVEAAGESCLQEPPATPLCDESIANPGSADFCDGIETCLNTYCPFTEPSSFIGDDCLAQVATFGDSACDLGFTCRDVINNVECLREPPPPPPELLCEGLDQTDNNAICAAVEECFSGCPNSPSFDVNELCIMAGPQAFCGFSCQELQGLAPRLAVSERALPASRRGAQSVSRRAQRLGVAGHRTSAAHPHHRAPHR